MQVCKQCGQAVQDVETYCPRCGSSQLAPDNSQRRQKPAINNHQKPTNIQTNGRVPQAAPPGYRNPNAPRVKQMQRPPMPHRQVQENQESMVANQIRTPSNQMNDQPQNNMILESQVEQNTESIKNKQKTKKSLFGKSDSKEKKIKAPKDTAQKNNAKLQNTANNSRAMNPDLISEETVTFKEWIVLMIKLIIPFYNIFVIYKILHDGNVKQSMREYVKAMLIFTICSVVIGAFGSLVFGTIISNLLWYI